MAWEGIGERLGESLRKLLGKAGGKHQGDMSLGEALGKHQGDMGRPWAGTSVTWKGLSTSAGARYQIRGSIVVSISACHAEDPGSIPGRGVFNHQPYFAYIAHIRSLPCPT